MIENACRKQCYVYGTTLDSVAKVKGLVKFDLQAEPKVGKVQIEVRGNVLGVFDFGPGRFGSEAIFIPRYSRLDLEEDDGYLIYFVHDENTGYGSSLYSIFLTPELFYIFLYR